MLFKMEPGIGIEPIKFGMKRSEVHRIMLDKNVKLDFHDDRKNKDIFCNYSIFVYYDCNDEVEYIQIRNAEEKWHQVFYNDFDLFETKAVELINYLNQFDSYYLNGMSAFGADYVFKKTGLHLWREDVFNEEDINQDWFKELGEEWQKEKLRYLYFELVGLALPEYWERKFGMDKQDNGLEELQPIIENTILDYDKLSKSKGQDKTVDEKKLEEIAKKYNL